MKILISITHKDESGDKVLKIMANAAPYCLAKITKPIKSKNKYETISLMG